VGDGGPADRDRSCHLLAGHFVPFVGAVRVLFGLVVRERKRLAVVVVAALLAAALLSACGGSGDSGSNSATTGTGLSAEAKAQAKERLEALKRKREREAAAEKRQKKAPEAGAASGGSGSKRVATPLKVSGGGSAQVRTKGGDNSIQEYGEESGESELREAAEAVHGFYVARVGEEWAKACSYLTKAVAHQFEELASQSPQLKGEGCAPVLQALTRPLPPSVARETTLVDAISLRQDGERAFLIYRGAEEKPYAIPMQQEGGAWKAGSLTGTPLSY
jgi:hypothetical protein